MGITSYSVQRANEYIAEHKEQVNPLYKPDKHLTAPIGWINDPNGFVYFRGEYHLFYQYYPYDSVWGPMHWGHAKSKDLVNWEHLPVALAPDQPYDKDGCFSGSAIVKDDVLWLMYTGHIVNEDGSIRQIQNMAYSTDGLHFEKLATNPVATGDTLPDDIIASDFRDPKLFEKNGRYYSVVAAKHRDEVGCIVLLGSDDLKEWQFESIFLKGEAHQGFMWECPDYFEINGKSYLIMSPMRYQHVGNDYANINSSVLVTGHVDWEKKVFTQESVREIDHGHDYYAPQSTSDAAGNRVVIAWQQMWGRTFVANDLKHGWTGAMTVPRYLEEKDGCLVQTVPEQVLAAFPSVQPNQEMTLGRLEGDWSQGTVYRLGTPEDYFEFGYNKEAGEVYVDRSHLKHAITGEEEWPMERRAVTVAAKDVLVLVDKSCLEIFINGGQETLSSTYYLTGAAQLTEVTV